MGKTPRRVTYLRTRIEGSAVRISLGFFLLAGVVALAGCTSSGNRKSANASSTSTPFTGTAASNNTNHDAGERGNVTPVSGSSAPDGVNGFLAGQVLDKFDHRVEGAYVQVIDLDDPKEKATTAKLDVGPSKDGYFTIKGLTAGHRYKLIARGMDGGKLTSVTTVAVPPNPRLMLYVNEANTTADTPPIPAMPVLPGKSEGKEKTATPAASIESPIRVAEPGPGSAEKDPPASDAPPAVTTSPGSNPALMAEGNGTRGFDHSPKVNIEFPGLDKAPPPSNPPKSFVPPASPETKPSPDETPSARIVVPGSTASTGAGSLPTPIPSCSRVGKKLDNFALYSLEGKAWEFRKDRKGRLTLIDFWYSGCGPCLGAIPHLVMLQKKYGAYGLEVVGIAYEKGPASTHKDKVRWARSKYGINYTLLMGGGGTGACPVQTSFDVSAFPTLVLIDESNQIVWTSTGLDANGKYDLEMEIRRGLNIR
jgi:thiol-disulfide isomerase/thioredoxin